MENDVILELVESLKSMMLDQATGTSRSQVEYAQLREQLMEIDAIRTLLPRWVRTHATLSSFERTMKAEYSGSGSYGQRGIAIKDAFEPILAKLSGEYVVPIDSSVADAIEFLDIEHIQITWHRALARLHDEPDAAITSARTLLESVCKAILENDGMAESDYKKDSLQSLFVKTWHVLDKKQSIVSLDGVKSKLNDLVAAFGTLRNEYGDAHGRGSGYIPPSQIEAEFAVNLSGTLALLLIRRWNK